MPIVRSIHELSDTVALAQTQEASGGTPRRHSYSGFEAYQDWR